MRAGKPLFVLALAALYGCATILGLEHNDGTSVAEGGGQSDARAAQESGREGGGGTGGGDGGSPDHSMSAGGDASHAGQGDARVDAPGCSGGFCACHADAQFCADFDESNPFHGLTVTVTLPDGSPEQDASGTVSITDAEAVSPPNSLSSTMVSATFGTVAYVTHAAAPAGHAELQFDVRLAPGCSLRQPGDYVAILPIDALALAVLFLVEGDAGFGLSPGEFTGGYSIDPVQIVPVTTSAWVPIDMTLDEADGSATLTVNNGASYPIDTQRFSDASVAPLGGFELGQQYAYRGECKLYFDNVVFNSE